MKDETAAKLKRFSIRAGIPLTAILLGLFLYWLANALLPIAEDARANFAANVVIFGLAVSSVFLAWLALPERQMKPETTRKLTFIGFYVAFVAFTLSLVFLIDAAKEVGVM